MNERVRLPRLLAWGAMGLMLSLLLGCGSGFSDPYPLSAAQRKAQDTSPLTTAVSSDSPGINLQCDARLIRSAPAPFHWSYRKIVPPLTNVDWEADVTANSIVGTFIDSAGAHPIHGSSSDPTSWNTAVMMLTGPLPTSTFALLKNSSAADLVGPENVNDQDTIKYAIDTTQVSAGKAALIRSTLGANGFVKGTAWVTRSGCPVKFVLDVEQHSEEGTVEREHYEANITKRTLRSDRCFTVHSLRFTGIVEWIARNG